MNKPKMPKIFKTVIALALIWWAMTLLLPITVVVYMFTRSAFWYTSAVLLTSAMCLTEILMYPSVKLWYKDKSPDDFMMDYKDACYNLYSDEEEAKQDYQDYEEFLYSDNSDKRDLRLLLALVSAVNAATMTLLVIDNYRTVLAPFASVCLMIGVWALNRIIFKKFVSNKKEASND